MRRIIVILFAGVLSLVLSGETWGQDDEIDSPEKQLYHIVEYSDYPDRQALTGPPPGGGHNGQDAGQALITVAIDLLGPPNPYDSRYDYDWEVDALANIGDAYFWEVVNDVADLLVSFNMDPGNEGAPGGADTAVWWEEAITGRHWRMWTQDDLSNFFPSHDPNFTNLDGLETYGNELGLANVASRSGDPGNVSVYRYGTPPTTLISHDDIVTAVQHLGYTQSEAFVNLDAVMVSNFPHTNEFPNGAIIFSITEAGDPELPGYFHGGELIVMPIGNPNGADWLHHGGHDWDHAWKPSEHGYPNDDVDAIEAWNGRIPPEPPQTWATITTPSLTNYGLFVLLVLLILSGIYVIYQRRKGVVRA